MQKLGSKQTALWEMRKQRTMMRRPCKQFGQPKAVASLDTMHSNKLYDRQLSGYSILGLLTMMEKSKSKTLKRFRKQ